MKENKLTDKLKPINGRKTFEKIYGENIVENDMPSVRKMKTLTDEEVRETVELMKRTGSFTFQHHQQVLIAEELLSLRSKVGALEKKANDEESKYETLLPMYHSSATRIKELEDRNRCLEEADRQLKQLYNMDSGSMSIKELHQYGFPVKLVNRLKKAEQLKEGE